MRPPLSPRGRAAFTMVELLTVIAIIAILAAILFPVFGTVQESARRGNTMTKLQKISQAVAAYNLDNREYPEYLFGPAISQADGTPFGAAPYYSMKDVASIVNKGVPSVGPPVPAIATSIRRIYSKSLYPVYVRDLDTFSCDNNVVKNASDPNDVLPGQRYLNYDPTNGTMSRLSLTANAAGNTLNTSFTLPYYRYDSYDASPKLLDTGGTIDNNTLITRYSRHWYPITNNGQPGSPTPTSSKPTAAEQAADKAAKYQRQLLWRDPPTETVITMTTHHAPKTKAVILWLSGTAKVIDLRKFNSLVDPAGDVKAYELGPSD